MKPNQSNQSNQIKSISLYFIVFFLFFLFILFILFMLFNQFHSSFFHISNHFTLSFLFLFFHHSPKYSSMLFVALCMFPSSSVVHIALFNAGLSNNSVNSFTPLIFEMEEETNKGCNSPDLHRTFTTRCATWLSTKSSQSEVLENLDPSSSNDSKEILLSFFGALFDFVRV